MDDHHGAAATQESGFHDMDDPSYRSTPVAGTPTQLHTPSSLHSTPSFQTPMNLPAHDHLPNSNRHQSQTPSTVHADSSSAMTDILQALRDQQALLNNLVAQQNSFEERLVSLQNETKGPEVTQQKKNTSYCKRFVCKYNMHVKCMALVGNF